MSEVWVVEHGVIGRQFALKVLHPRMARFAERMRVEAETLGRLNNPYTVGVVDFWVADDGRPCIVMELLQGRTLGEELRDRHRIPTAEALDIARQVLLALEAAHGLGVVHRDLHLDNVYLHEVRGYGRVVKVLDFGVARVMPEATADGPQPSALRTITGVVVGSPQFMSPEAWRGAKVDARADLYSLGVILYLMLAGQDPFDEGRSTPFPPSRYAQESFSSELDHVILRTLEESPEGRYQSARELLTALEPWLRRSVTSGGSKL
jgi:eukaryotic-like serine/threonine-protein kinase